MILCEDRHDIVRVGPSRAPRFPTNCVAQLETFSAVWSPNWRADGGARGVLYTLPEKHGHLKELIYIYIYTLPEKLKWKLGPWKRMFQYKQVVFYFHGHGSVPWRAYVDSPKVMSYRALMQLFGFEDEAPQLRFFRHLRPSSFITLQFL